MNRTVKTTLGALTYFAAVSATPAGAVTIANPTNSYSAPNLSGSLTGGNQTQYFGETFTAPITGSLTDFQFTLNTSTLQSVYGIVFGWNGASPTTELYRSAVRSGAAGLFDFAPTGVQLTQGQTYVAFLSTYGLTNNSGLATLGTCLPFAGCNSNSIPNLGTLVTGNVLGNGPVFSSLGYLDATFSATISAGAVPEPATWAMIILGLGAVGCAMRRRQNVTTRVSDWRPLAHGSSRVRCSKRALTLPALPLFCWEAFGSINGSTLPPPATKAVTFLTGDDCVFSN